MGITRRSLFPLAAGAIAWAQEDADFSTGISVVNVLASVRDKQGRFLNELQKEDFVLEENGLQQPLRYFSTQSDQPLTLGFLIDVSGSEMSFIPEERRASYRFIDKVLREDRDKAFILRFYQRVELLNYLTSSRTELETALNRVEEPPPHEAGKSVQQGRMFLGTALYDAVFIASDTIMKKQQGRKAIILMTDGDDTGSSTPLASAIEAAQRADTLIYTLGFYEPQGGGGRRFGRGGGFGGGGAGGGANGADVMQRLARESGGRYFDVTGSGRSLDATFNLIEQELRNQYSLGYVPERASSEYRKIRVTVKTKGAIVTTRDGYYANRGAQPK